MHTLSFYKLKMFLPPRGHIPLAHSKQTSKSTGRVDAHLPEGSWLDTSSEDNFDWTAPAQSYPNLEEAPTFISRSRQEAGPHTFTTSASPDNLQGRQVEVYTTVKDHFEGDNPPPLRIIVTGVAGTGKFYLILCIRLLLGDSLKVSAPTGVASFIIEGTTLHLLLHIPTRGKFKQLEGTRLQRFQQAISTTSWKWPSSSTIQRQPAQSEKHTGNPRRLGGANETNSYRRARPHTFCQCPLSLANSWGSGWAQCHKAQGLWSAYSHHQSHPHWSQCSRPR